MARSTTRGARLTALALATGTLAVAATGSAGASTTVSVPDVFGGAAKGTAVHIEINLPVPVNVPGLGNLTSIVQDISFTDGTASKAPTQVTSVAKAVLGNGTVKILNDVIGKSVTSSLTGKRSDRQAIISQDLGLIKVGVGEIISSVSPEGGASALTSTSSSSLASLRVGLAGLPSLPVDLKKDLTDVTTTLDNAVNDAQGTVNTTVDTALAALDEATNGATAEVTAQVKAVKAQLTTLLDSLQKTLKNLTATTDLVALDLLQSTNTITRKGEAVEAKATSSVGGLSILGGLVQVDAVKTDSFSRATGRKGAGNAAAKTLTTVLGLKVADVLDVKLTGNGLEGTVLGNALPAAAKDAVNQALSAVNGLLATAGVQILNGKTSNKVDPNGQFAESNSTGVGIVVNPLKAAKPLVAIQLVPAGTAVNAKRLAKPVTPRVNPPARPQGSPPPLARTGAELPLFAIMGTGLAAAALIRRRREAMES